MNKQAKRWEDKLRKAGLGVAQPLTDNSEGEMAQMDSLSSYADDFTKLRTRVDGGDSFMTGHQIMKARQPEKEIPEWAMSDIEVRRILLTAFPKSEDAWSSQRKNAGIWMRIIQLYYRMGLPSQQVAKEMKISQVLVKRTLVRIGAIATRKVTKSRGRKKVSSPTPLGGIQGREK